MHNPLQHTQPMFYSLFLCVCGAFSWGKIFSTLMLSDSDDGITFCVLQMCVFMCLIVQEELAFVFEMLQQFEDALVQYDELDALFTQYVLNFGAGGTYP